MKSNEFEGRETGGAIRGGEMEQRKGGEEIRGVKGMNTMNGCSGNGWLCVCMCAADCFFFFFCSSLMTYNPIFIVSWLCVCTCKHSNT